METKVITVCELIKGNAAVATDDGDNLFKEIVRLFEMDACVILDFKAINIITTTFLNAAIGQLYSKYDSPFLQKHLKVLNMSPEDKSQSNLVVEKAKQYFKNKQSIENPVKDVMDEEHDS
jgi:hypothetical protein